MSEQNRPRGIDDPTRVASVSDVEKLNAQIERVQAKSDARLAQLLEIERTSKALIEADDARTKAWEEADEDEAYIADEERYDAAYAAWRKAVNGE